MLAATDLPAQLGYLLAQEKVQLPANLLGLNRLFPRNAEEIIMMGMQGVALSRASGCVVAMNVVADVADRISVMYAGRIVERADVDEIYAQPGHPYTKGLLESIPRLDQKGQTLSAIGGLPPNLTRIPQGCAFNPRCVMAQDICRTERPELLDIGPRRQSACHFSQEVLDA